MRDWVISVLHFVSFLMFRISCCVSLHILICSGISFWWFLLTFKGSLVSLDCHRLLQMLNQMPLNQWMRCMLSLPVFVSRKYMILHAVTFNKPTLPSAQLFFYNLQFRAVRINFFLEGNSKDGKSRNWHRPK